MSEQQLDALLARMAKIAEATNVFSSEAVQLAAFDALISAFDGRVLDKLHHPASPERSSRESSPSLNGETNGETKPKAKRRTASRKKADNDSGSSGISADAPKLDKYLDTSKLGTFFGQFEPKNNAEKILIFLKFITEELELEDPNSDQVYTCYKKTGEKIPKAYAQAFYDTSSKHGFIDFRSATDIAITIAGDNHFTHGLKKKGGE